MGKKRKAYFNNPNSAANKKAKLKFGNTKKLEPNMKGFLITYNCKFTFCLNESKKLLQQFSLPNEKSNENIPTKSTQDLEKLLQEELDDLNKKDKEFTVLDTGANYTIFIKVDNVNHNQVVESIFEHIEKTKKPLGRYVQRLMPILNTCKAYLEDIEKCLKSTFNELPCIKDFETNPITFSCILKTSNNNTVPREEVFKIVGAYFQSINKSNKVDFDKPDYVIHIQVICNICFLSLVKKFYDYKKYNLIEFGNQYFGENNKNLVKSINKVKTDQDSVGNEASQAVNTEQALKCN